MTELDAAEADAILQRHQEWVAAGRPGARSHEDVMAELLGGGLITVERVDRVI